MSVTTGTTSHSTSRSSTAVPLTLFHKSGSADFYFWANHLLSDNICRQNTNILCKISASLLRNLSFNFGTKKNLISLDNCVKINLGFVSLENMGSIAPVILKLGRKVRFTPRPLYPHGNISCFPLSRSLGGPQNCSGSFEDEIHLWPLNIIIFFPTEFNLVNWR